jgi:hypothetical protein
MASTPSAPLLAAATGVHVAGPARPNEIDPFFKKSDGVLKTYEIDYDKLASFDKEVAFSNLVGLGCFPPVGCIALAIAAPVYYLFAKQNINDVAHAQHLAITPDGIRFVVDRHKAGCRLDCQDVGKVSKTVPYDKMCASLHRPSQPPDKSSLPACSPVIRKLTSPGPVRTLLYGAARHAPPAGPTATSRSRRDRLGRAATWCLGCSTRSTWTPPARAPPTLQPQAP